MSPTALKAHVAIADMVIRQQADTLPQGMIDPQKRANRKPKKKP